MTRLQIPFPRIFHGEPYFTSEAPQDATRNEPPMNHHFSEFLIGAAIATLAAAEAGIRTEAATPDQLLILWSMIGGFMGALCSLKFFPAVGHVENGTQLGVNLLLSIGFSPLLIGMAGSWLNIPVGLRLALPVSMTVGAIGQAVVCLAIPYGKKWLESRATKLTDKTE